MSMSVSPKQAFDAADSPLSQLSSPASPSFNSNNETTVFAMLYNADHCLEFVHKNPSELVTAGCEHLAEHKKNHPRSNESDSNDLVASYRAAVRYSLAWQKSRRQIHTKKRKLKELPLPQCSSCTSPLSNLHVCLSCVYMGCWRQGHMRNHMKEKKHNFAMDFRRRTLYCLACADYVYDTEFEEMIVKQEILMSNTKGARRKRPKTAMLDWQVSNQDAANVTHRSTLASCRGVRGLCNMGNTCFMNVILQSFVHNPLLKAYFLSDHHNPAECRTKFCLCCEMINLFTQIYSGKKEPYGPCSFLQSMWMSVKELAGYAQQDAHEFFISALNNIHAGCEGHKLANCDCIVHKTFAGLLQSNVTCSRCGNVTTTVDPMLDISLGLRPVEKKKKAAAPSQPVKGSNNLATAPASAAAAAAAATSNGKPNERRSVDGGANGLLRRPKQANTLMDCLDRYTQPEKLGPNEYSCSNCGNTFQEATKQLSVKRLPPVLSFQLKRFEHGSSASKIETKIKFPVELDMTPYTTLGRQKSKHSGTGAHLYTLFAVINHQGKLDSGHYTMYSKHRGDWFKFEDHHVTTSYQKDVLESKAYMCFYIKKSLDYEEDDLFDFK
ncbi:hypothetical protein BCR43DRAFT_494854 [Syncephalastrum racemosum]|uniref:Ubiquitin carboxyl-terminal hydrolase n=1 Tax=Syncephalastrum racemosum TaxID=13706 RepID=A0A1X2H8T8_SYNRA|nr:hypothetical protein BCR43DRAFT_494854 [Syncephalastrum racemosum]